MTPGGIMYPRFVGIWILHALAKVFASHLHSSDLRLTPIRLAAAILTPLYGAIGLIPVLLLRTRYHWRIYAALYCSYNIIALYVFYPYDMPSIALISFRAYLVLERRLAPAFWIMMLTGVFRESSLHIVWFALVWAVCDKSLPRLQRIGWSIAFSVAFTGEYLLIRHFFPSFSAVRLDLHDVFFGGGLLSLTCLVTIALVAIFPIQYLITRRVPGSTNWR